MVSAVFLCYVTQMPYVRLLLCVPLHPSPKNVKIVDKKIKQRSILQIHIITFIIKLSFYEKEIESIESPKQKDLK